MSLVVPGWARPYELLKDLPVNRHILIANISMIIFVFILVIIACKAFLLNAWSATLIFAFWFIASGWCVTMISTSQYESKMISSSDWSSFVGGRHSVNLAMDCIPIDPLGWAVGSCHSVGPTNWLTELFYSPKIVDGGAAYRFDVSGEALMGKDLCALGLMTSILGAPDAFFEATARSSDRVIVGKMAGNISKATGQVVLRPTEFGCINNVRFIEVRSSKPYRPMINRDLEFTPIFYVN